MVYLAEVAAIYVCIRSPLLVQTAAAAAVAGGCLTVVVVVLLAHSGYYFLASGLVWWISGPLVFCRKKAVGLCSLETCKGAVDR